MTIHEGQRLRRSPPEREGPLRHPAKLFRAAQPERAPAHGARAVEAAVDTAYRVYEEYIGWGKQSAAARDGRRGMRPNTPDMQGAAYWFQMWQEAWRMWASYMLPFMSNAPGMAPFGPGMPFPFAPPRTAANATPLQVEIDTSQPTSISLNWLRPVGDEPLSVRLHREEGEGALQLRFEGGSLRVSVPEGQAPGTYSGVVRDGSGSQCGMLTLTLRGSMRVS